MATPLIDPHEVPERAIKALEATAGVIVTVHDLDGTLWPYLDARRLFHRGPVCDAVKLSPAGHKCRAFEMHALRNELAGLPEGRVHICHAGLLEAVAPVFSADGLRWVLFAGQRMPAVEMRWVTRDPQPPTRIAWPAKLARPAEVDDESAQHLLESVRQLAARLTAWADVHLIANQPLATRTAVIRKFVQLRHRDPVQLADLAAALHMSKGRTVHIVRELFGKSFQHLLTEARLSTAAALLRTTAWPISEVAARSGWRDASRFHRVFQRAIGVTPRRYRVTNEVPATKTVN